MRKSVYWVCSSMESRISAEERATTAPKVWGFCRPLTMAPKPPMERPPRKVSSRRVDRGKERRVKSTSSWPMNLP